MVHKTNYFAGCKTVQDKKKVYFQLANELHPDKAGENYNQAAWLDLQNQYDTWTPTAANFEWGNIENDMAQDVTSEQFYNLVKNFDKLQGIKIEFMGIFIYLSDEVEGLPKKDSATFKQKDILNSIILEGFNKIRWHGRDKKWYYSPEGYKRKGKGMTHEAKKNTFGCTEFNSKNRPMQTALNF